VHRTRPLFFVKIFATFLIVALTVSIGRAQHAGHTIPVVATELLERAITVRDGTGSAHDAVATKSSDAQRFYDQGLAYLHSYVWIDAARSLHQALRLDPSLAIAHAALSLAYIELNKPAEARAALERARALASNAPDHDRRHIEARALQSEAEANPRDTAKLAAYRQALDAAIAAFPSDIEFLLQRGIAESADSADRGQGSVTSSIPYFEKASALANSAFAKAPAAQGVQFAAQHYLTHAYENTGKLDAALKTAEAYAKAAPNVPHAHHMYGHNLRRAGRTLEAIAEFEAADRLHREYFKREAISAEYDWHFHHNLDLLATSHQYLGQMKEAAALLKQSFDLPSNVVVQVYNKHEWPSFLRGRGRRDEALAASRRLIEHPHPLVQAAGHIEAGYTLVAGGRWGDAANESNTALRILREGAEGAPIAAPALLGLQGEIALRTADREKGRRLLLDAAGRWRALPGPDSWVQALFALESMARAARQVGDWQLAGEIGEQMLAHDPSYAGTHYALALVAEHDGNATGASREFTLAQKYWSHADPDLPELADSKKRLKEQQ
jgi:tetratricopeptide (TPR) repeat protein